MPDDRLDDEVFASFLDTLRRFVRERLVPAEAAVIAGDRVPEDVLAEMRELGLFGLTVPVEYGGSSAGIDQYVEAMMELSWAAPAFRSALSIGSGMVTTALKNDGTEAQKAQWLPRLAAGEIASFALTEPGSGSDSARVRTSAVRDGDCYVLTGTKRYITNAPMAKFILVMARTSAENLPGNGHVSAFLVPADAPGLSIGKPDHKMGQSGALTADVVLEEVRVPADALLGGVEGRGFKTAMKALNGGRLSVSAAATGYSRRILDSALRYATEREAFGEPISGFQLIQAMLADSQTDLYAAECMLRDAAGRAARGEDVQQRAACVKLFTTEAAGRIADRTVQIYGGAGYMAEYEAERFYRDVRVYRIYEGTSQIMQLVIAKALLKAFAAA
jgi:acyl-CoA dehydrogenase